MNWDAIGAAGEIIGAIAVIITVGYLALQIRQNTAALRSGATQGANEQAAAVYHTLCTDDDLAMIFVRASQMPDQVSDAETARYFSFLMMTMFNIQNWYLQTQENLMDDTLLNSWGRVVNDLSATPGFQRFWEMRGYIFAPEFQEYMQNEVFNKERDGNYRPLGVGQTQ